MIMYDIVKNCKEVKLNDIIARQVLLSNIKVRNSVDFFIGERYKFLKDFYKKCKNDDLGICSLNLDETSTVFNSSNNEIQDSYIKNSKTPKNLYVIDESNMTNAEKNYDCNSSRTYS